MFISNIRTVMRRVTDAAEVLTGRSQVARRTLVRQPGLGHSEPASEGCLIEYLPDGQTLFRHKSGSTLLLAHRI
jgi:hypothetical protein